MKLKKFFFLLPLLSMSITYAIPKKPITPKSEVCCRDLPPDPLAFSFAKDMDLACPQDFYFNAELLVMQPKMEGLEYALTQNNTDPDGGAYFPLCGGDLLGYSTGSHDWDWDLGFRIGFGFYLKHDKWSLDIKWTNLHMSDNSSVSIRSGALIPLWIPPIKLGDNHHDASARWKGHLNTLDVRVSKPYHISRYFILNPHFGIRATWIDQNFHPRYSGSFDRGIDGVDMLAKNDFWGIGMRGGFDTEFILRNGWNLFGNLALCIVYGKVDLSQEVLLPGVSNMATGLTPGSYNIEHDFHTNIPNLEMAFGIAWGKYFNKRKNHISLKAAYEFHHWWDMNNLRRFFDEAICANDTVSRGDLEINGFSFKLEFNF